MALQSIAGCSQATSSTPWRPSPLADSQVHLNWQDLVPPKGVRRRFGVGFRRDMLWPSPAAMASLCAAVLTMRAKRPDKKEADHSDPAAPPLRRSAARSEKYLKMMEQLLQYTGINKEDIDVKAITDGGVFQDMELHGLPIYSRERQKRVTRQMRRFSKGKAKAFQDPLVARSNRKKRTTEFVRPSLIAGKVAFKESLLKAMSLMWAISDVESRFRQLVYDTIANDSSCSTPVAAEAVDFFHDVFLKAYNYLLLAAPVAMLRDANYKAFGVGSYALLPLGIRLLSTSRKFDSAGGVNSDLIPDCAQWRRMNVPGYYDVFVFDCYLWGRANPLHSWSPLKMDEGTVPLALTRHDFADNVSWAMAMMCYFLSGEQVNKSGADTEGHGVPLVVLPRGRANDFCQCLESVAQDYMGMGAGLVAVDVLEYDPATGPDEKAFENQHVQHSVVVILLESTYPPDESSFSLPFTRDGSTADELVPVLVVRMNGIISCQMDHIPTPKSMNAVLKEAMEAQGREAFAGADPGFDRNYKMAPPNDQMFVQEFMSTLFSSSVAKTIREDRARFLDIALPFGERVASQVVSKYFMAHEFWWRDCRGTARQALANSSLDVKNLTAAGDIDSFERGAVEVRYSLGECQWVEGLIAKKREPLEATLKDALRSTSAGDLAEFDAKARLLTKLDTVPAWLTGLIANTRAELVNKKKKEAREVAREFEKQIEAAMQVKMVPIEDAIASTEHVLKASKSAESELRAVESASYDRLKQHYATLQAGVKLKADLHEHFKVAVNQELQRLTAEDVKTGEVGPFTAVDVDAIPQDEVNSSLQQTKEELKKLQLQAGTGTIGYVLVSKLVVDASSYIAEAFQNRALFQELGKVAWRTGCPSMKAVSPVDLRNLLQLRDAATSAGKTAVGKRLAIVLQAGQVVVDVQEAMRERRLWHLEALVKEAKRHRLADLHEAEQLVEQLQKHVAIVEDAIALGDSAYLTRTLQQVKEQVTDMPQEFMDAAEQRLRAAPVLAKLKEAAKAIDRQAFEELLQKNGHLLPSKEVLQDLEEQMQQEIRQIEEILGDVTWLAPGATSRPGLPSVTELQRAEHDLEEALEACQANNLAGVNATYDAAVRSLQVLRLAIDLLPKHASFQRAYDKLFTHLWTEPEARVDGHEQDGLPLLIDMRKAREMSLKLVAAAEIANDEMQMLEEGAGRLGKQSLAALLIGPLLHEVQALLEEYESDAALMQELKAACWGSGRPDIRTITDADIHRLQELNSAATKRCQDVIKQRTGKIVDGARVAMELRGGFDTGLTSKEHLDALDILLAKAKSLKLSGLKWATERRAELEAQRQASRGAVRQAKDRLRKAAASLDTELFEKATYEATEVVVPLSFVEELRKELTKGVNSQEQDIEMFMQGTSTSLGAARRCLASTSLPLTNRHVGRLTLLIHTLERVESIDEEVRAASVVLAFEKVPLLQNAVNSSRMLKRKLDEALLDVGAGEALQAARTALLAVVDAASERITQLQQEKSLQDILDDAKWREPSLDELTEHDVEMLREHAQSLTVAARHYFDPSLAGALAIAQCAADLNAAFSSNDVEALDAGLHRARDLSIRGLWQPENRLRRLRTPVADPTPHNFVFLQFDLAPESSLSIAVIVTDKDLEELDRAYRFVLLSGLSLAEKAELLQGVDADVMEPLSFFCLPETATLITSSPDLVRRSMQLILPRVHAHLGQDALDPQSYLKFLGLFSPEVLRQREWQSCTKQPSIKQGVPGNDYHKVEHALEIARCIQRQAELDRLMRSNATEVNP